MVVVVVCVVEQSTTFQSSVLRLNTISLFQITSMELFPAENSIHENLLQRRLYKRKSGNGKVQSEKFLGRSGEEESSKIRSFGRSRGPVGTKQRNFGE